MKIISKDNLIIRDSFKSPYAGGEIWYESLDALSIYTELVREKFLKDMETIRRPSTPAFIVIHLHETLVDRDLAEVIVNQLSGVNRRLVKVVFVGIDHNVKRLFNSLLKQVNCTFSYQFIDDLEKAKKWLLDIKF